MHAPLPFELICLVILAYFEINKLKKGFKMRKKTVLRIIILALILIWMIIIFNFSNQNGEESSNLSRQIASKIVSTDEKIAVIEPYIRKIAHLSEYAIGGVLFICLFLTYNLSDTKRIMFSIFCGTGYAIIDEIHQLYITGRSGQIVDVFIDTIGVLLGSCMIMLIHKIFSERKEAFGNKQ